MTPKLMQKIQEIFRKHANFRGTMHCDNFSRAVAELVPDWSNYPAIKPDAFTLYWVVRENVRSGSRGVTQFFWNGTAWVHPGGIPLEKWVRVTYWMPVNVPELP